MGDNNGFMLAQSPIVMPTAKTDATTDVDASQTTSSKPGSSKAGLDAFRAAVELTERDAQSIDNDALQRSFAPPANVIKGIGESVAASLEKAKEALKQAPADAREMTPLARRLDEALGLLFAMGRHYRVPMREAKLEAAFDIEDEIRLAYTGLGRANRGDIYYDENVGSGEHAENTTATSDSIQTDLGSQKASEAEPRTRDDLIKNIMGFAGELELALKNGLNLARTTIVEPSQPKQPNMLETLIETAMNMFAAQALSGLNAIIGSALRAASHRISAEEHLGEALTDILLDGFKDGVKDAAVDAAKPEKKENSTSEGLSAKSMFLVRAEQRTSSAISQTRERYKAEEPQLRRVPVATLQAVSAAFNDTVKERVERSYGDLIVHQWVDLMKDAFAEGEDLREIDKQPAHPSKLDQLDPPGVLKISVSVRDQQVEFRSAEIPGIGDAVLEHIRGERGRNSLGTIPLYRRVEAFGADQSWFSGFNLDTAGKLAAEVERLSPTARHAWARIAGHQVGDEVSDGDVYAGMKTLQNWLGSVGTDKIKGPE